MNKISIVSLARLAGILALSVRAAAPGRPEPLGHGASTPTTSPGFLT